MNFAGIAAYGAYFVVLGTAVFAITFQRIGQGTHRAIDALCITVTLLQLCMLVVYAMSWVLGGAPLNAPGVAAGLSIALLFAAVLVARPEFQRWIHGVRKARDEGLWQAVVRHRQGLFVAGAVGLSLLPFIVRVVGQPWPGDLGGNTQLTNQLSLGNIPPDVLPFKGGLSRPYPFLSFVPAALAAHLIGIGGGLAVLGQYIIIGLTMTLCGWALMMRLTDRWWVAFAAVALTHFFAGFDATSDYNQVIWGWGAQVLMPDFMQRMNGMLLLILGLYFVVRYHQDGGRRSDALWIGICLGLLLCTHPYSLLVLSCTLLVYLFLHGRRTRPLLDAVIAGATALLVGSPMLAALLRAKTAQGPVADSCQEQGGFTYSLPYDQMIIDGSIAVDVFGILIPFVIGAAVLARKARGGWMWTVLATALAMLLCYTVVREVLKNEFGVFLPLHPMQHRLSFAFNLLAGISLVICLEWALKKAAGANGRPIRHLIKGLTCCLVLVIGYVATSFIVYANTSISAAAWFYQSENESHIAHRLLANGVDDDAVVSIPDALSPVLVYQTGLDVLSVLNLPGGYTPCRYAANKVLQKGASNRQAIERASGRSFDRVFDAVLSTYEITHLVLRESEDRYAEGRADLSFLTRGSDHTGTLFNVFRVDAPRAPSDRIDFSDPAFFKAAVGDGPMCVRTAVPHRVFNMVARRIKGFHARPDAFWLLDETQRELLQIDRTTGEVVRTYPVPPEILKMAGLTWRDGGFEALGGDGTIWRLDLEDGSTTPVVKVVEPTLKSLAWDGVNYVSVNSALDRVQRVSATTGEVVETVQVLPAHHGAVAVDEGGALLVSSNLGSRLCRKPLDGDAQCYFDGSLLGIYYLSVVNGRIFSNRNGWVSLSEVAPGRTCSGRHKKDGS